MKNWTEKGDALHFEHKFKDFSSAFAFLTQVAILAEKHNHHPTIENTYNKVTLILTTHDAGNTVTEKDHKLAEAISKLL